MSPIDPLCTQSLTDNGTITVNYDSTTSLVNMAATLPTGSYAGWGWGASMVKTEMVIFSADGDSSDVTTYYSSGTTTPDPQTTLQSCYTWTKTVNADTTVTFAVTRPLDCGIENSYVV